MSNTAQYQCSCGWSTNNPVAWEHHARYCRGRVNWNSGIIATVVAIVLAVSLLASPAKAQQPNPQPTPSIGEPPAMIHRVFLPYIATSETVLGCDDCQAVSWRPTGDMKW
mgnify:CR=1 FL=1